MMQFYLLSVIMNLCGGYALYSEGKADRGNAFDGVRAFLGLENFRLVTGILCMITGVFKLLTVTDGDIPIIGDFSPALIGLLVGFTLLFEFYRKHSSLSSPKTQRLEAIFLKNKGYVGMAGMAASLIHFVFPRVLFL